MRCRISVAPQFLQKQNQITYIIYKKYLEMSDKYTIAPKQEA